MKKSTPLWMKTCFVFVSFIIVSYSVQVVADDYGSDSEGISIDCGYNEQSNYVDKNNFYYEADGSKFVETGQIHSVSSDYILTSDDEQLGVQLNTLRSFPEGKRNCYTLKPRQGRNNKYLIRAFFRYGNYDTIGFIPVFRIHVGVNKWISATGLTGFGDIIRSEVIHVSLLDHIDVCLVNIERGIPFISLLELWPLPFSLYLPKDEISLLSLKLITRSSLGMLEDSLFFRYPDDIYRRSWFNKHINNSMPINTSSETIEDDTKEFKLPKEVLSTAIKSLNSSSSLNIYFDHDTNHEYYVYLHFFDFEEHSQNQNRSMEIAFSDTIRESVTLEYKQLQTKVITIPEGVPLITNFSIRSSPGSSLPPMINAYEIYRLIHQHNLPTHEVDAEAMRNIKRGYNIQISSWQGDPCMPMDFRWEGVTCNYSEIFPRVISLNMSSSKLEGEIDGNFSELEMLGSLDLSNNQLTGEIPQSLANLSNLKVLNLTGNDLIGFVPENLTLREKSGLTLRLEGNRGLCLKAGSCKTKKFIGPVVASALASMAVLLIIVYIPMMLFKRKRKQKNVMLCKKGGDLKSKCQAFSEDEVLSITNNFESVIGEGGFGKVYLGKLQDGTRVAVKLLSKSSQQGFNEFESEAKVLSMVYHKNLLSLVGYCDDGDMRALIYEYMEKGNLSNQLSGKNHYVLKWDERLQIALDAASGLNYLHNDCNPPIIHRDLKSSNILLSENMHAKIADFGLSKSFASDTDTHVSTRPAGTFGYLDPDFYKFGNLHKYSDVYSFGIILLELMTGRSAIMRTEEGTIHIVDWVTLKFEMGDIESIMDPKLEGNFNNASARKVIEIAMSCVQSAAIKRPDISNVENGLKQCLALDTFSIESAESSSLFSSTTFDTSFYHSGSHSPPHLLGNN